MQDSRRTTNEQRAYLERRNALWQKLRQLEPGDKGVEELLLELAKLTGQTRAQIEQGLGWLYYSVSQNAEGVFQHFGERSE